MNRYCLIPTLAVLLGLSSCDPGQLEDGIIHVHLVNRSDSIIYYCIDVTQGRKDSIFDPDRIQPYYQVPDGAIIAGDSVHSTIRQIWICEEKRNIVYSFISKETMDSYRWDEIISGNIVDMRKIINEKNYHKGDSIITIIYNKP